MRRPTAPRSFDLAAGSGSRSAPAIARRSRRPRDRRRALRPLRSPVASPARRSPPRRGALCASPPIAPIARTTGCRTSRCRRGSWPELLLHLLEVGAPEVAPAVGRRILQQLLRLLQLGARLILAIIFDERLRQHQMILRPARSELRGLLQVSDRFVEITDRQRP